MVTGMWIAAGLAMTVGLGTPLAIHTGFRAPRRPERGSPADWGLSYREVSIPTDGGKQLFGWYMPAPDVDPAPAVVLLHGWGGNAEDLLALAPPLHAAGYHLLSFDVRNHGRSDSAGHSSMVRFAADLEHALDWMAARNEVDETRIALIGHSVGAAAGLLVASRGERLAAVVTLGCFADPGEMTRQMMRPAWLPEWLRRRVLRYIEWVIGAQFEAIAPVRTISEVHSPVLLIHGECDRTVPVTDAEILYRHRGGANVRLLRVAGAGHRSVDRLPQWAGTVGEFLTASLGGETLRAFRPES
jgi:pimeloyl-ACP methyl ester carboxylesterase